MCSIIGSFSRDTIVKLAELNAYRGQRSYSIAYFNTLSGSIDYLERGVNELPVHKINIKKNQYCIVHQQAPTTETKTQLNIHPAADISGDDYHYLWHNGIIKQKEVERLQQVYNTNNSWDTALLLKKMIDDGTPEGIDGTFSCLMYSSPDALFLFRNEISPMFIDKYSSISSTAFDEAVTLPANIVWRFRPGTNPRLVKEREFTTVENPYFFMD